MKTDIDIQKDVIAQLRWEPFLNAAEIGVVVKNGIVTLSGVVDMYSKKLAAETAARKVAGVKALAEDIQVAVFPHTGKTDEEVAMAVLNALKWHTTVPEDLLKIKVEDGVVTLEGEVPWNYQRFAAASAVGALLGVRKVNNLITIKPMVVATDVKGKIAAAFGRTASLDASRIQVDVVNDGVILKGKVRSFAESEDALSAAWAAPGVTSVKNRLEIDEEVFAL